MSKRRFAVGIVACAQIVEIAEEHLTLREAAEYITTYSGIKLNQAAGETATILPYPLPCAIREASSQFASA